MATKTLDRQTEKKPLAERLAQRKRNAVETVRDLAHREAIGEPLDERQTGDLLDSLECLQLNDEFFQAAVDAIKSGVSLDAEEMKRRRDEHQARADELGRTLKALRQQVRDTEIAATAAANAAQRERDELGRLGTYRRANPFLFAPAENALAEKTWPATYEEANRRVEREMESPRRFAVGLPPLGGV